MTNFLIFTDDELKAMLNKEHVEISTVDFRIEKGSKVIFMSQSAYAELYEINRFLFE